MKFVLHPFGYWLALLLLLAGPVHAARLALVVGNSAYTDSPLKNPVNDARAVDSKLSALGFTVTRVENLKRRDIGRMLNGFASRVKAGDEVVVFYAGHGVQVKGINYLPAVDAEIQSEEDVPLNSVNLAALLDRLDEAKAGVKILFLDACRNNPYARSFRSGARGLARVQDAPSGTLMHFATRPGSVAADGSGANGLYTTELLRYIDQPGTPIEQMLKRVAAAVERESKGQQEPWAEGSLKGDFYFKPGNAVQAASLQAEPVTPTVRPGLTSGLNLEDLQKEEETRQAWGKWQSQMKADFDKTAGFSGSADLQAKAWQRFLDAWAQENPLSRQDDDLRRQAGQRLQNLPELATAPKPVAVLQHPANTATASSDQPFKECIECPEMLVIPAGSFQMGTNERVHEMPIHGVNIDRFSLGKYEVTQGQWRSLMGSNPSYFSACGDECPVEQVSWSDIQEYIQKLNQKTGQRYRLPSEAEWEYAARAGTQSVFWWGDSVSTVQANYDGTYSYYGGPTGTYQKTTLPVNSYEPNPFGLYNVHGNVSEWVQDNWHDSYSGAPTDGSAWETGGDQDRRVLRGGSWLDRPVDLRSARRFGYSPAYSEVNAGFRLARAAP